MRTRLNAACAALMAFGCAHVPKAKAHAIAGARVFPATLAIDDPGVNDELALPTFSYMPLNPNGAQEFDLSFNYAKTITSDFALSVGDGWIHLDPGGSGFRDLDTGVKYLMYVNGPHEFMASVGVNVDWANTGSANFTNPFDAITPSVFFGKGFGDLPRNVDALRPFAATGQLGFSVPTESATNSVSFDPVGDPILNTQLNPTTFNWGFTLQYSLPYYNSNVAEIEAPDFFKRLIPIVEVAFQTPIANVPAGAAETTGTIQPGLIYMADAWEFALEALVPANAASGRRVGAIGELHFFLDDIFPNSLGKPIFGAAR